MKTKSLNLSLSSQVGSDITQVLLGGFILALCAPLAIPLPFSPIPLAVQPHVALLLGVTLGPRKGFFAVLSYLIQGVLGFPIFAGALGGGLSHLAGPKGGYLLGYLIAAALTGLLVKRASEKTNGLKIFAAMGAGNLVIYLFGAAWLSHFIGIEKALLLGVLPFLLGDLLKLGLATKALLSYRSIRGKLFSR